MAIEGFTGNPFDGHTTEPLPNQMKAGSIKLSGEPVYDRGGRGKSEISGVKIIIPSSPKRRTRIIKRTESAGNAAAEPLLRR